MDITAGAMELGRRIGAGTLDPVELTEACLDATAAHPLAPRIYARMTETRARAEAEGARARATAGLRRGPLDGVPLSWKDLYDTAGTATEAGTAMMAGRVPDADAAVLTAATGAGTVCLGKTHLSEIAFSGLGWNPVTATPPCVNDADAVPGGSSSGAAASVAFGLAPAAIGSDTGGSIRLPAAWNDLVGFKPAHGHLPLTGVVPLCARFDTVGPLCRRVEDAGPIVAALGGAKAPDLTGAGLSGLRLMVLDTVVTQDLDPAPGAAFDTALSRLSAAGAQIVHATFAPLTEAYDLALPLYGAEAWAFWRPHVERHGDRMFPMIRERVTAGGAVLAADWIAGWDRLHALRRGFAEAMAGFDAVLCPTAAILPPKLAALADPDTYRAVNLRALRNTRMGNLMGLAAVSLPTGTPSCGIMLHVQPGDEGRLLRIAAAAERALA